MPRFDFDGIFTGEMKEQHCRATHFLRGIAARVKEEEASYAEHVVREMHHDAHAAHDQIHRLEAARDAFTDDERTQNLQKWIDAQCKKEQEEKLHKLFAEVVSQIFQPK